MITEDLLDSYYILKDEEIEILYSNYTVINIEWNISKKSGWITLEKNGNYTSDNFIIRPDNDTLRSKDTEILPSS